MSELKEGRGINNARVYGGVETHRQVHSVRESLHRMKRQVVVSLWGEIVPKSQLDTLGAQSA